MIAREVVELSWTMRKDRTSFHSWFLYSAQGLNTDQIKDAIEGRGGDDDRGRKLLPKSSVITSIAPFSGNNSRSLLMAIASFTEIAGPADPSPPAPLLSGHTPV